MSEGGSSHPERVARMRAAAGGAPGAWGAKRELARALRELLAAVPGSALPDADLLALVPVLRDVTARARVAGRLPPGDPAVSLYAGMEHFQDTGPLVGLSNAIAPPLEAEVDPESGLVRASAHFSLAYEGAPGLLHGGVLAAAFDELLGLATVFSGGAGMTRELTVRYLRPTPVGIELHFVARLDRSEGRRLYVSAEVEAEGVRTAEASGLFLSVGGAKFEQLAQARRERQEG